MRVSAYDSLFRIIRTICKSYLNVRRVVIVGQRIRKVWSVKMGDLSSSFIVP